jgi:hypothetical protein|tara:strand:- start:559 stop:765 length:207 start_codon:yes stop_codon:yes gene_type:complete
MYQGKGHVHEDKFNKISDFMERWYVERGQTGPRPINEYRGALRNNARIAYRVAKQTLKQIQREAKKDV